MLNQYLGQSIARLLNEHIEKIVSTYQFRKEEPHYTRRVSMKDRGQDFNLNISRYIRTTAAEQEIDLRAVNAELFTLAENIVADKDNAFLKQASLPRLS